MRSRLGPVAIVGPFGFPDGGAAARRILGLAQSLKLGGVNAVIASGQGRDRGEIAVGNIHGFSVHSIPERTYEGLPRALKHLAYVGMGARTVRWLEEQESLPSAVVLYSGYSPYLLRLIEWTRKRKVKLVFDAVEWYDPASLVGWLSPYQLNIELAMRVLVPKARNVIAISSFLDSYFRERGCRTTIVPPTLDVRGTEAELSRPRSEVLRLVYAGSPGNKDHLAAVVQAVRELAVEGHQLHLAVVGLTAAEFLGGAGAESPSPSVGGPVSFLGRLSHADSIRMVRDADFTVLFRRDARYSRAGFATKFVESLAVGTPVIANVTGDLHRYHIDRVTGIVAGGVSVCAVKEAVRVAASVSDNAYRSMRMQARASAESNFDVSVFAEALSVFTQSNPEF